ncbi:unnamed protein product [Ambrosiozyma monospora]|uniref:Unnamed protein product n=1 Tax=Ambrosiozyma monospora TaxID=43982 RepID=A0ACB5U0W5_AMBMO|nr:unnamed protein product [Ambrosiozyma monospora]
MESFTCSSPRLKLEAAAKESGIGTFSGGGALDSLVGSKKPRSSKGLRKVETITKDEGPLFPVSPGHGSTMRNPVVLVSSDDELSDDDTDKHRNGNPYGLDLDDLFDSGSPRSKLRNKRKEKSEDSDASNFTFDGEAHNHLTPTATETETETESESQSRTQSSAGNGVDSSVLFVGENVQKNKQPIGRNPVHGGRRGQVVEDLSDITFSETDLSSADVEIIGSCPVGGRKGDPDMFISGMDVSLSEDSYFTE